MINQKQSFRNKTKSYSTMKITEGVIQLLRDTGNTFKHITVYDYMDVRRPKTMMSNISEDVLFVSVDKSITDCFERYRRSELMRRLPTPETYVDQLLKILPPNVLKVEGILYIRDETGKCSCRVITTPYLFRYLIDARIVTVCSDCFRNADPDQLNACPRCEAIYCYDCSQHMISNPICNCGEHLDIVVVGIKKNERHTEPFFVTNTVQPSETRKTTYHACINKRDGDTETISIDESPSKKPRTLMDVLITPPRRGNSI